MESPDLPPPAPPTQKRDPWKVFGIGVIVLALAGVAVGIGFTLGSSQQSDDDATAPTTTVAVASTTTVAEDSELDQRLLIFAESSEEADKIIRFIEGDLSADLDAAYLSLSRYQELSWDDRIAKCSAVRQALPEVSALREQFDQVGDDGRAIRDVAIESSRNPLANAADQALLTQAEDELLERYYEIRDHPLMAGDIGYSLFSVETQYRRDLARC